MADEKFELSDEVKQQIEQEVRNVVHAIAMNIVQTHDVASAVAQRVVLKALEQQSPNNAQGGSSTQVASVAAHTMRSELDPTESRTSGFEPTESRATEDASE